MNYGAIDTESFNGDWYEGRAAQIEKDAASVVTTSVSPEFLQTGARRVHKSKVPKKWIKAIEGGQ